MSRVSMPNTSPGPYSARSIPFVPALVTVTPTEIFARPGNAPPVSTSCTSATNPRRVHGKKRYCAWLAIICPYLTAQNNSNASTICVLRAPLALSASSASDVLLAARPLKVTSPTTLKSAWLTTASGGCSR